MAKIVNVSKDGFAKKLKIKAYDHVTSIGGYPFVDVLDYIFFDEEQSFEMTVLSPDGKSRNISVNKPEGVSLGLEFEELSPIRCKNKCKFCFVDQLPKGLRSTLYVKDDDYRYSFISGSYITLTNLTEFELNRIIRLHLSPLYISVHAFDDNLRVELVKNPNAKNLINNMRLLAENGIVMHTQVVMCQNLNDGAELQKTMEGLYKMYPSVRTLAVVPVGLTGHREGLCDLAPITKERAAETVKMVESFNKGKDFCWCSDELYLKAELPLPSVEAYGDFYQIENGVGLIASFNDNLAESLDMVEADAKGLKVVCLTGTSFKDTLEQAVIKIKKKIKNLNVTVQAIENNFFGKSVTVAGLVTGGDIIAQARKGADLYLLPHNMLREFEDVFLDGVSLDEVKNSLGRVEVCDGLGENLVEILLKYCK